MRRDDWLRRYPPLTGALAAVLLAVVVLPSALNVPQSNPTQTLEFAPVPLDDQDEPPPPQGNTASVGLGSSSTVTGDAVGGQGAGLPPPPPVPEGTGARPVTKRCVGDPPRQTEDPMSPPCVAHFDGDNGGATYQGVTGQEIGVLIYYDGGLTYQSGSGIETTPQDEYFDLAEPAQDDDPVFVRTARALQTYFNRRFQTYGRFVHFHVYFAATSTNGTPETRRADAQTNVEDLAPFAAFAYPYSGYHDEYVAAMAQRGALNFGGSQPRRAAFFREFPGMIWGYRPSLEQQARQFSSYVCRQVVGHPVSVGGNEGDADTRLHNGQPRRLGLLSAASATFPEYTDFADLVAQEVEACGGEFVERRTYQNAGYSTGNRSSSNEAVANVAALKQAGVTTIVWPQGYENEHSKAAAAIGYRPEWIVAGDELHEGERDARLQDQSTWGHHAFVVTNLTRYLPLEETPCYRAYREADPNMSRGDISFSCGFAPLYEDLRQLFTGIQVAGPRLGPESMDRGFHAIPAQPSTSAEVPACFYLPGDYTCVKDATVEWWDESATGQGGQPGCWRMLEDGARFTADTWRSENVDARRQPDDPCNAYNRLAPVAAP
ncbi:MAG TPA: hypothetical protein VGA69_12220 [Nitriliruptorales bacterium]